MTKFFAAAVVAVIAYRLIEGDDNSLSVFLVILAATELVAVISGLKVRPVITGEDWRGPTA